MRRILAGLGIALALAAGGGAVGALSFHDLHLHRTASFHDLGPVH
jgi:hypothetical protein